MVGSIHDLPIQLSRLARPACLGCRARAGADALRRHHLDGRLDTEELQERLERAYAARTTAELRPLLADLPRDEEPRRGAPPFAPWPPLVAAVVAVALVVATLGALAHGHPGPLPFVAAFLLLRFASWGPWRRRISSARG